MIKFNSTRTISVQADGARTHCEMNLMLFYYFIPPWYELYSRITRSAHCHTEQLMKVPHCINTLILTDDVIRGPSVTIAGRLKKESTLNNWLVKVLVLEKVMRKNRPRQNSWDVCQLQIYQLPSEFNLFSFSIEDMFRGADQRHELKIQLKLVRI